MKKFMNASIKRKLIGIQMVTTFTVLIISFAIVAFHDVKFFSHYLMEELASTAKLLSSNSASAVTFMDKKAAENVLASLDFEADIVNAWIFDDKGHVFASYSKEGWENSAAAFPDTAVTQFMHCYVNHKRGDKDACVTISRKIKSGDITVGMLSLRLNLQSYKRLFMQGALISIVVLVIGMAMALGLANLTQRKISRPILKLADAGKKVTATGDYTIRVKKENEDELGVLSESFNNLMEQIHVREQERDIALEEVRQSEKSYRDMLDNMNDGMVIHSFSGEVLDINEHACEIWGVQREKVQLASCEKYGLSADSQMPPELKGPLTFTCGHIHMEIPEKYGNELMKKGKNLFDAELRKKDGTLVPVMVSSKVISRKYGGMFQSVIRDITERKQAEESLRESEQKYRSLFKNMNDGFAYHQAVFDKNGEPIDYFFLEVNDAFGTLTGIDVKELVGKRITEIVPEIKNMKPDLIKEYGNVAKTGNTANFEMYFEPFRKWYSVSAYSPEKGFFCTVFKDITDIKKSQETARQHQEKLIQTDKMTTLGILVSGVAHEINNPNNFMLLNSNNLSDIWKDLMPLLDKYKEDKGDFLIAGLPYSEARDDVGMLINGIADGAGRIREIVDSLKNFARKDPGNMDQPVNVNNIIESALIIMSNLIKKSTDHLTVLPSPELPAVKGNAQQIEQVIINLISNACQSLENKTKSVNIITEPCEDGKFICVKIIDEGKGISSESKKHIMDPFYTTKRDSGGTGLGLSISYTIIKDHRGELTIESEEGKGTTASIKLPVT